MHYIALQGKEKGNLVSVASSAESKLTFCISKSSGGCSSVQEAISLQIIQLKQSVDTTILDLLLCCSSVAYFFGIDLIFFHIATARFPFKG